MKQLTVLHCCVNVEEKCSDNIAALSGHISVLISLTSSLYVAPWNAVFCSSYLRVLYRPTFIPVLLYSVIHTFLMPVTFLMTFLGSKCHFQTSLSV